MEEKIIEARFTKNTLARILFLIGAALFAIGFIGAIADYATGTYQYSYGYETYLIREKWDFITYLAYFFCFGRSAITPIMMYLGTICMLFSLFYYLQRRKCALTVTNKRVTGKSSFGKHIDLPLNQISAVALGNFGRITVATSSGKIHFWLVENLEEVHRALTEVIASVQMDNNVQPQSVNVSSISNADELEKFKTLLDKGIITQEEFDAKKKQLLGI